MSCVLFSEKHRGFAFIEFELAEVCTRYNAEMHTIDINPIKTKLWESSWIIIADRVP